RVLPCSPRTPAHSSFPYTTLFRSLRKVADGLGGSTIRRAQQERSKRTAAGRVGDAGHRGLQKAEGGLPGITNATSGSSFASFLLDRKSTRLNSSHGSISYAVFCLQ